MPASPRPSLRSPRTTAWLIVVAVAVVVLTVIFWRAANGPADVPTAQPPSPTSSHTSVGSSSHPTASGSRSGPATPSPGNGATDPVSGLPWIEVADLPAEARATLDLIAAGGPFPYPRNDNKTFDNRERILPAQKRGYYKEFTVITPGSPDRGARRIITGSGGERYWTDDHYDSFSAIRETR